MQEKIRPNLRHRSLSESDFMVICGVPQGAYRVKISTLGPRTAFLKAKTALLFFLQGSKTVRNPPVNKQTE
jgi:hypothetical protein